MSSTFTRTTKRLTFYTAVAVAIVLAHATISSAASGGGCGNTLTVYGGTVKACISAPGYAHGRGDGYVSYAPNQPGCTLTFRLWNAANVLQYMNSATCAGAGAHPILDFHAWGGSYHTTLEVRMAGRATVTAYSPGLTLP